MSRKEKVFNFFKDCWIIKWGLEGDSMLNTLIDCYSKKDPSGNNKYLHWMVDMRTRTINDDLSIINNITKFHKMQNNITIDDVNNAYLNNPNRPRVWDDSLDALLLHPKDIKLYTNMLFLMSVLNECCKRIENKKIKTNWKEEVDTILDNDDYLVVVPLTHQASIKLGFGTKWCTTMKDYEGHFKDYTSVGTLYYIIDKLHTDPSHPLHKLAYYRKFDASTGIVYNAPDQGLLDIVQFMPKNIIDLINKYHKKQMPVDCFFEELKIELSDLCDKKFVYGIKNMYKYGGEIKLNLVFDEYLHGNEILLKIQNFNDWKFAIKLKLTNENTISYEVKLMYCGVAEKTSINFIKHLNKGEVFGVSRCLAKGIEPKITPEAIFLTDILVELTKTNWLVHSQMIHRSMELLCPQLSTEGWLLKLESSPERIMDSLNMKFSLHHQNQKLIHGDINFDFEMDLTALASDDFSIRFVFSGESITKYEWDELEWDVKNLKITQKNLTIKFTKFVEKLKKHLIDNKKKIKPEPPIKYRNDDYLCDQSVNHDRCYGIDNTTSYNSKTDRIEDLINEVIQSNLSDHDKMKVIVEIKEHLNNRY